ncbi:MAG: hypothetical protein IPJ41_12665 [Phycisphaerales bacterium]|nr:hypothetical protein [Phycisphaerales bacterium]
MSRTQTLARLEGRALALLGLGAVAALMGLAPVPLLLAQASDPPDETTSPASRPGEQPAAVSPENSSGRVTVFCKDGRRVEGRLVRQDPSEVVIEVAGLEATFNMADVFRVDPVPSVEEHYKKIRAVIRDDDTEQLLLLVDWLRDREAFGLALKELAQILKIDPANDNAIMLKKQIESLIKLKAESAARGEPEEGTPHGPAKRRPRFPTLTDDQINLLKVYEVDLGQPPRMLVDRDTVKELIDAFEGNELIPQSAEGRAALERRPPERILELMFRLKARDFYGRVKVEGEPTAFKLFRENVHRGWVVNSCATNACHGGELAGRLWLDNENQNSERTIYTNFLILDRYRLPDGTPLINYEDPARSPLLQMALPREESLYPHPLVATTRSSAWRPVIGSEDDRRFRETIDWINAMYRPRPEYPVTYAPPVPTGGVPEMPREPVGDR